VQLAHVTGIWLVSSFTVNNAYYQSVSTNTLTTSMTQILPLHDRQKANALKNMLVNLAYIW